MYLHFNYDEQVTGKPTPRVNWFFNNQPVKETEDVVIYQDNEGVCKLAINEVFPEIEGLYTCEAMNAVGEAVCTTSLIVEGIVCATKWNAFIIILYN